MAKAETHTMTKLAKRIAVATILTGLNICLNCEMKPIKKPVPVREMRIPKEYSTPKAARDPVMRRIDPKSERAKPTTRLWEAKHRPGQELARLAICCLSYAPDSPANEAHDPLLPRELQPPLGKL